MNKLLYFSIFGGHLYYVQSDEEKILDPFQIPLLRSPNSSCKKCYGRFYTGYDTIKRHFLICNKCGTKCIDAQKMSNRKIIPLTNGK
jgi:hypothetical protein